MQCAYGHKIYYAHENLSYDQIKVEKTVEWIKYNKTIYEGFDNGVYWFKIELPQSKQSRIIRFPESHITRGVLYANNKRISRLGNTRYLTFSLPPAKKKETYYVRIDCFLDATIPLEIKSVDQYRESVQYEFMKMGGYYGIVLSILLINLFSYFSFKGKTYLHYMFMVIGMSINAFYKDGLFALLLGSEGINEYLEPVINSVLVISSMFFTASFLEAKKYSPKRHLTGVVFIGIAMLTTLSFCITGKFLLFTLAAIFHLIALDVFWSIGLKQWECSFKAKLFTVAYGVPLLFAHGYYISPHFGFQFLHLPLGFYKVGSIFEMVFFTYAIMYETKRIARENKTTRKKLMEYASQIKELNKKEDKKELSVEELRLTYDLTTKEITVLQEVALAKTNKEIAELHFISVNTVKYHIRNILNKFEVKSKKEARKKFQGFI